MTALEAELAALVATASRGRIAPEALEASTQLIYAGEGLDSVEVLELVVSLEERFGIELGADDISYHLAQFGRLVAFVTARLPP